MGVGVIAVVALTVLAGAGWLQPRTRPAADRSGGDDWPGWGFTHTQYSADAGPPGAVAAASAAIGSVPMVQAQHIMGFGADNPEPAPGSYDFASLDLRMRFIHGSGGVPVIVLCCAPDWMKGGQPGSTDWNRLEAAPLPAYFDDFAALSATVARRYPYVRHFIVWNEFKGFFDDERKRWNAERYTALYNKVYTAVKAVNPANRVGGPYLDFARPFDSTHRSADLHGVWGAVDQRVLDAFTYWQQHRVGADFVAVDGHADTAGGAPDEFTALEKFASIGEWLRRRVDVPIWWAEWYVETDRPAWTAEHEVALRVAAMIVLAGTGAQTVMYWNVGPGGPDCPTCLWTDPGMPDGGQPLPFLTDVLQRFAIGFPPVAGPRRVPVADGLLALASSRALVVVNTTAGPIRATVYGRSTEWSAYETKWISP